MKIVHKTKYDRFRIKEHYYRLVVGFYFTEFNAATNPVENDAILENNYFVDINSVIKSTSVKVSANISRLNTQKSTIYQQ